MIRDLGGLEDLRDLQILFSSPPYQQHSFSLHLRLVEEQMMISYVNQLDLTTFPKDINLKIDHGKE